MDCLHGIAYVKHGGSTNYSITDPLVLVISLDGGDCVELAVSGTDEAADTGYRRLTGGESTCPIALKWLEVASCPSKC